jgi:deoxycytidylate deaminase
LKVLIKNDSIDEARELGIYETCPAETCLRMLIDAGTGAVVTELTLMLDPDFASRLQ